MEQQQGAAGAAAGVAVGAAAAAGTAAGTAAGGGGSSGSLRGSSAEAARRGPADFGGGEEEEAAAARSPGARGTRCGGGGCWGSPWELPCCGRPRRAPPPPPGTPRGRAPRSCGPAGPRGEGRAAAGTTRSKDQMCVDHVTMLTVALDGKLYLVETSA